MTQTVDPLIQVQKPDGWQIGETMMMGFFPNLCTGMIINGGKYCLKRNNDENKFQIDWGVFNNDGGMIAAIDTEHKPEWSYGRYPFWSVARYTWRYNKGEHNYPTETIKMRYYRQYPDHSFWMPIRSDYHEAGIITGRKVIESPMSYRPQPKGFARDIEIYEFPQDDLVFCEILESDIEDFVISHLANTGVFDD